MTTSLVFHDHKFNVVTRNNQIWLSAVEIAQALQYKNEDAVSRIYARNSDEFSPQMTETVKLTVSGNIRKTSRIFSLRGAHLIAMFARTPVAKEFRRWVLDILDKEVNESVTTPEKQSKPTVRGGLPSFRYLVRLTYIDTETGIEETFSGGANFPSEIIQGTAKHFGIYVPEMITMPVTAFL
ncbi:hypothetical protein IRL25_005151 [Salmonella enterica]|nr:hypothetical protein [Salmonella enterica]EBR1020682.1 hypothetical protein [Salmonella enterica]EGL8404399.1 hypothetical protein [Salmonella enterica]EGL8486884.1 hypothetical protein [Salmonella enterica]EGL8496511.1 hypothetical protein [Salmonella enterica]